MLQRLTPAVLGMDWGPSMGRFLQSRATVEAAIDVIKAHDINGLGGSIDSVCRADAAARARFGARMQDALNTAVKVLAAFPSF